MLTAIAPIRASERGRTRWVGPTGIRSGSRFGAGQFDKVGAQIAGRRYALVTYDMPITSASLAAKLAAAAGAPVVTIDNIDTNPDVVDLVESCRALRRGADQRRK